MSSTLDTPRALLLSLAALLLLSFPLAAAQETPAEEPAPENATAEETPPEAAPPEEDLEAALAEVSDRVAELEASLAEIETGPPDPRTQERLALWRDLATTIRTRITLREELKSAEAKQNSVRENAEKVAESGLAEEPPYSVDFVDQLLDAIESAERDLQTAELGAETAAAAVARAESQLASAEEARRTARDKAAEEGTGAAQDLAVRAQTAARLAQQRLKAAEARRAVAETALSTSRALQELANTRLDSASGRVEFSDELLETRAGEIASRRQELEQELTQLRRTREANEQKLTEARQRLSEITDEAERPALLEQVLARGAWSEASIEGLQYLEERIRLATIEEQMWRRRHALVNETRGIEIGEWSAETRALLDELERDRALLESRLADLRATQIELENQLSEGNGGFVNADTVRSRLEALRKHEQEARGYVARLQKTERLASRLDTILAEEIEDRSPLQNLLRWWAESDELWAREVFVIDDYGFTVGRLTQTAVIFLVVWFLLGAVRRVLRRWLLPRLVKSVHEGSRSAFAVDVLLAIIRDTKALFFIAAALYASLQPLHFTAAVERTIDTAFMVVCLFQVAIWLSLLAKRLFQREQTRIAQVDPSMASVYGHFTIFTQAAIWAIVILLALASAGQDINGLIAGLGIGGIAIAFALQNILGDIFCSLAILMDKPFIVGDFIVVGEEKGEVEKIGIKTTRVRGLGGEQVIFSNADLIGSRVHNFKRMQERRAIFHFGVIYETDLMKLRKIPDMVKKIIEYQDLVRLDRVHFQKFGDYSLDFECVYYVQSNDYAVYMDIQQGINFELFQEFKKEGIEFAYPTTREIFEPASTAETVIPPHMENSDSSDEV